MGDTLRLRRKLALLACLPCLQSVLIMGAACNDPLPTPSKAEQARGDLAERAVKAAESKTAQRQTAAPKRSGPRMNEVVGEAPASADPEAQRMMPTPGDPPFIDGYNPEEEPCPSGNWCGSIDSAMAIAPNPESVPKELECPVRITGTGKDQKIAGAKYAGLSSKPSMQGSINKHGTELARAGGDARSCCYHWFEYCSGRPLVDDGAIVSASAIDDAGWARASVATLLPNEAVHDALVAAWLGDAAAEHASVASFARVVLELLAVGAPSDLVAATIAAGQDEVAHARACYAIASRLAGRAKGPGALPAVAPRESTLQRVAVDTFLEGCIGETIAALCAERAAARAEDPEIRTLLETIAEDEGRHAALAWRTLHWALREGGREVADAVREAAAVALAAPVQAPATPEHDDWARFGRLGALEHERAVRDARRDIIGPMLRELV